MQKKKLLSLQGKWVKIGDQAAAPSWDSFSIPLCEDTCPYFDGKRCSAIGLRPDRICEPVLQEMMVDLVGK